MLVLVLERKEDGNFAPFEFAKSYKSFEAAIKNSFWISQDPVVVEKSEECWVIQHSSAGKTCLAYLVDVAPGLNRAALSTKLGTSQGVMSD